MRHPVYVTEPERFRDADHGLVAFTDLIYVACPACSGRATIIERPGLPDRRHQSDLFFRPRRLSCQLCGVTREWTRGPRGAGIHWWATPEGPADPFFGLPLWLQTQCQGHVLWAYNQRHLDVLERYISARLREERRTICEMGMLERLPGWIKAAGNRDVVLRAIEQLRLQLSQTAPGRP